MENDARISLGSGLQSMGMRNQVRSTVDDSKVDQRLAREPNRGEVKFKQIKLVDKRSHNEILLLIRK